MKIKTLIALMLCCLLAAGLAACGTKPAGDNNDPATGGSTQLPNPMVTYENAEFPDFSLVGYPDRNGMKPTAYYLIDGTLAQINYENATLRAAATEEGSEDLSGVYYASPKESELTVGHSYCNGLIFITVKEYAEGTVALWKSCEGDYTYSLWLPEQTGEAATALVEEFAASVHVESTTEPLTGHVLGTEKELTRWREVIHAGNIAKVTAKDHTMTEPTELPTETAERMIKALADSESALKLFEKPENPATGGTLNLTAYDGEGNRLFTACYNGWLVVTFGGEMTNYVFDAGACGLAGKFALD